MLWLFPLVFFCVRSYDRRDLGNYNYIPDIYDYNGHGYIDSAVDTDYEYIHDRKHSLKDFGVHTDRQTNINKSAWQVNLIKWNGKLFHYVEQNSSFYTQCHLAHAFPFGVRNGMKIGNHKNRTF